MIKININGESDTKKLALILTKYMQPDSYFLMSGDLGAGKTTLTKFMIQDTVGVKYVGSPTFVIVNQYKTKQDVLINHMDAYRLLGLEGKEEWEMYLEQFEKAVNIIEWPSIIEEHIDSPQLVIRLEFNFVKGFDEKRVINLECSNRGIEDEIAFAFGK